MRNDAAAQYAAKSVLAANASFRNVAGALAILLVGLHCFNAYVAYSAARAYVAPSPVATKPFALGASLTRDQLVAGLLAAQDYVETTGGEIRRTLVLGATVAKSPPLKGANGTTVTTWSVTLHLVDGRDVTLF